MNEHGEKVEDAEQLKNLAVAFYRELFTTDPRAGEEYMKGCFSPLSDGMKHRLEEDFTMEEIEEN